jgi:hypothetical protein
MIQLRWHGYISGSGFLVSLYNSMDHTFSILYFTPDTFTNRRENSLIPLFQKDCFGNIRLGSRAFLFFGQRESFFPFSLSLFLLFDPRYDHRGTGWICVPGFYFHSYSFARPGRHLFAVFRYHGLVMMRCAFCFLLGPFFSVWFFSSTYYFPPFVQAALLYCTCSFFLLNLLACMACLAWVRPITFTQIFNLSLLAPCLLFNICRPLALAWGFVSVFFFFQGR